MNFLNHTIYIALFCFTMNFGMEQEFVKNILTQANLISSNRMYTDAITKYQNNKTPDGRRALKADIKHIIITERGMQKGILLGLSQLNLNGNKKKKYNSFQSLLDSTKLSDYQNIKNHYKDYVTTFSQSPNIQGEETLSAEDLFEQYFQYTSQITAQSDSYLEKIFDYFSSDFKSDLTKQEALLVNMRNEFKDIAFLDKSTEQNKKEEIKSTVILNAAIKESLEFSQKTPTIKSSGFASLQEVKDKNPTLYDTIRKMHYTCQEEAKRLGSIQAQQQRFEKYLKEVCEHFNFKNDQLAEFMLLQELIAHFGDNSTENPNCSIF